MADKILAANANGGLTVKAGTTSLSVVVHIRAADTDADVTGLVAANMTAYYWRPGDASETAIVLSDLSALDDAYSSGGVLEIDATNMPGLYRLDIPDAALAAGADFVVVQVKETGSTTVDLFIALPTYSTLATAITDDVIEAEGSITLQQALSVMLAVLAGRTSNGGLTFATPDNAATRVTATTNSSKERTAITLTPSA